MKCYMCEEEFTDEEIEEMFSMGERIYREGSNFICSDCYDDYHRLVLEDQFAEVMKGSE